MCFLVRILVEVELIVHSLLRICDYVDGEEVWRLDAPFGSATTKDIGEKRIMIGRDCGFFVVADSVSSLGNDWNRGGVLGSG